MVCFNYSEGVLDVITYGDELKDELHANTQM